MVHICIEALYRKPNTSKRHPVHLVFTYLLNDFRMPFARLNRLCIKHGALFGKLVSPFPLCILLCSVVIPVAAAEHPPKVAVGAGGCSTTGATNAITLSNVPARITGVAPLAVFFDASGTTAGATTRPFHDLEYRWNFGDKTGSVLNLSPPLIGTSTWNAGSRAGFSSRNTATGPVSAHVYETPGIYNVSLDITDGTNTVSNSCTQIVVQDPDLVFANANTICIGATSEPTQGQGGCPSGANTALQPSFTAAISNYAKAGKRVLFKRGDTFTAATTANITATGPGTVGSFGSGALPIIRMTGNSDTLILSSRSTPKFGDWRVMDLELDGMGSPVSHGIGPGGGVTQVTTLRLTMRNLEAAIGFGGDLINWWNNTPGGPGGHTIDQLAIVDSTVIYGPNTAYGGYNAGNRVAFMGNNIDNGGIQIRHDAQGNSLLNSAGNPANGSHVTRFPYLGKAVISNNSLSRPGFDRLHIKLHAPFWIAGVPDITDKSNYSYALNGDGYTKQVIISDNKFTDYLNPWSISIGPQDSANDARLKDIILERNLHVTTPASQAAHVIRAQEVTSRNNLFMGGGSNSQTGVVINVDGGEPPASNVRVYNNTQYSADAVPGNQFIMVDIRDSRVSNITIKNNLAYAPNAREPLLFANAGAANVVVSNNSTNTQIKNTAPGWASSPALHSIPANFKLTTGSYALGTGGSVPVFSDFFLQRRLTNDLGATEK